MIIKDNDKQSKTNWINNEKTFLRLGDEVLFEKEIILDSM